VLAVIETVAEFIRLVESDSAADRRRSAWEEAAGGVWLALIEKHPEMRFWVAHNRTLPVDAMRILAADEDWRVRARIAMKASCPGDVLDLLSSDPHDAVASTVAGHPGTPTEALQRLSRHPWVQVREKALQQLAQRGG
jgi:hypothetical protein